MDTLPVMTQTAYAELLEQLLARDANRSIGTAQGAFVDKDVKGRRYVYFQHSSPGGVVRQTYVGPKTREIDALVERFTRERALRKEDDERIEELGAILRAGGAQSTDAASARVIAGLERSGVFKLGGVLVGTQAFIVLGNVLGIRLGAQARTEDIDVAVERVLEIAVPELDADIPRAIESLAMGFLPVLSFNPKDPSTSFKVRGKGLRVDLVTPATGKHRDKPVPIPRLKAAAAPLAFLDFLLEETLPAAVVGSEPSLVTVPSPARFAIHKLIVAQDRSPAFQSKVEKDLAQAATLVEALEELRPGDLGAALAAAREKGKAWIRALERSPKLLARISADVSARLEDLVHRT